MYDAKSNELESNPRPAGCIKLVGEKEDLWRVRVGIIVLFTRIMIQFL